MRNLSFQLLIKNALIGTAAVNIRGETTASTCQIKQNKESLDKEQDYKNSMMWIVDEVSFMNIRVFFFQIWMSI